MSCWCDRDGWPVVSGLLLSPHSLRDGGSRRVLGPGQSPGGQAWGSGRDLPGTPPFTLPQDLEDLEEAEEPDLEEDEDHKAMKDEL